MTTLPAITPKLSLPESVAVVGNSAALRDSSLGHEIDQHDCVIRFNGAVTDGFETMVGSKTDIQAIGIDIAYLFHPRYRRGSQHKTPEEMREIRLHNALEIVKQFPVAKYVTFDASNSSRNESNQQYASAAYLKEADPSLDVFSFIEKGPGSAMRYYEANKDFESLSLLSRLRFGGPRTGVKIVLRLVLAGIKPTIYGFDIDPSIKHARHYFDDVISDEVSSYKPHDIQGEMLLMSELASKELVSARL
jgi:hypothetical protein